MNVNIPDENKCRGLEKTECNIDRLSRSGPAISYVALTILTMKCSATLFITIVLVLPFLSSCNSTKKLTAGLSTSLPPLPQSIISIPVTIYAKPLLDKAEALAPPEFVSDRWPGYTSYGCDFRYKYRFVRSGLKFSALNNKLSISLTGNYQVAGSKSACILGKQVAPWINGSCGFGNEPLRRVEIALTTSVRFLPDYTLQSKSVVENIHPVDKCSVTFLSTDVTGMVMNTVRTAMDAFAASLDHDIAALNVAPFLRLAGTAVSRQITLGSYGYLLVNPSSMTISPFSLTADTLHFTAGFSCYPELSSVSNGRAAGTALPPLLNTAVPPGFILYANASFDYPSISRLLAKAVKNKMITTRGNNITIDSIAVTGTANNRIELKAAFSGGKKGVIYLTGTPVLDTGSQVISVPDLNFSLQSKSFALNAGKTFFNKNILRAIRKQAVINVSKLYQQKKPQLDHAFTRRFSNNIFSSGNTEQVRLRGLLVKKEEMTFQVFVKGKVYLNYGSQK